MRRAMDAHSATSHSARIINDLSVYGSVRFNYRARNCITRHCVTINGDGVDIVLQRPGCARRNSSAINAMVIYWQQALELQNATPNILATALNMSTMTRVRLTLRVRHPPRDYNAARIHFSLIAIVDNFIRSLYEIGRQSRSVLRTYQFISDVCRDNA